MKEETKEKAITLFENLTNGYRSRSSRTDSRILFHIRLEKIEGLMPHDVQFMHNTQSTFCYEYTRFRNVFSKPKIRKTTMNAVKDHFQNRDLSASFKPGKKNPERAEVTNQLQKKETIFITKEKAIS